MILLVEFVFWLLPAERRQSLSELLRYLSSQVDHIATPIAIAFYGLVLFVAYVLGFAMRQTVWRLMLWISSEPEWEELYNYMCKNFRRESVDEVLAAHPALLRDDGLSGGAARQYCKTWLRMREPRLGVDHLEAEVNILFAYISPLVMAPFIVLWPLESRIAYWIFAPLAAVAVGGALALMGRRLRDVVEPHDTMMNFFIAQWIRND